MIATDAGRVFTNLSESYARVKIIESTDMPSFDEVRDELANQGINNVRSLRQIRSILLKGDVSSRFPKLVTLYAHLRDKIEFKNLIRFVFGHRDKTQIESYLHEEGIKDSDGGGPGIFILIVLVAVVLLFVDIGAFFEFFGNLFANGAEQAVDMAKEVAPDAIDDVEDFVDTVTGEADVQEPTAPEPQAAEPAPSQGDVPLENMSERDLRGIMADKSVPIEDRIAAAEAYEAKTGDGGPKFALELERDGFGEADIDSPGEKDEWEELPVGNPDR